MKVRIGMGLGTQTLAGDGERFAGFVDALEERGFDSLWLSERLTGPAPDPLMALAVAAGRTRKLKLGTSVLVVPGRNPVVLAKELASLDRLSGGRLLPARRARRAGARPSTGPSGSTARRGPACSTRPWRSCAGCGPRTTSTTTASTSTSTA